MVARALKLQARGSEMMPSATVSLPCTSQLAMAAALVAELGAVALILGEAAIGLVGHERTAKRLARWAGFGLLLILSLQSVAGIIAGLHQGRWVHARYYRCRQ